jgi:hypothetical protein
MGVFRCGKTLASHITQEKLDPEINHALCPLPNKVNVPASCAETTLADRALSLIEQRPFPFQGMFDDQRQVVVARAPAEQ